MRVTRVIASLTRRIVRLPPPRPLATYAGAASPFVTVSLPRSPELSKIRVELRRGAIAISVTWPICAAAECAAWMLKLLQ